MNIFYHGIFYSSPSPSVNLRPRIIGKKGEKAKERGGFSAAPFREFCDRVLP
jgi:hypothetical protein